MTALEKMFQPKGEFGGAQAKGFSIYAGRSILPEKFKVFGDVPLKIGEDSDKNMGENRL